MKILIPLFAILLLAACSKVPDTTPMSEEEINETAYGDEMMDDAAEDMTELWEGPTELKGASGLVVVLDNIGERATISSPLELTGSVRRDWMFEGSFPITLMTLEEEVVKEWYGTGPWLEPIDGKEVSEMEGDDMIPFQATLEFTAPEGGNMGKIRFGKSMVAEEDTDEYVELMILWP